MMELCSCLQMVAACELHAGTETQIPQKDCTGMLAGKCSRCTFKIAEVPLLMMASSVFFPQQRKPPTSNESQI